ncbi:unannotated protein [freshwater metagenome]|uniref:Unannotated protein n=1 Tax=freshwater metagenome TaxID=449393 RepID=A0A6J6D305_9ZZZZ
MCARRNEADLALLVTPREVVATNSEEAGEFALASRVGLQRDRVVTGHVDDPRFELTNELEVALDITSRRERVNAAELAPGDGFHFGR